MLDVCHAGAKPGKQAPWYAFADRRVLGHLRIYKRDPGTLLKFLFFRMVFNL